MTTNCPECGKEFWYHRSWPRKYCSQHCSGRNTVYGNANITAVARSAQCEQCGTSFVYRPGERRGRFCSARCFGDWLRPRMSGANNPAWQGGYRSYYGPAWKAAQRAIRLRDPMCQRCCALPETVGQALDVHHLIPFREFGIERHAEANAHSNLIALCHTCHQIIERASNPRAVQPASLP